MNNSDKESGQHSEHAQNRAWAGRGKLSDLVAELERQKKSKVDFVADSRSVEISAVNGKLRMNPKGDRARDWIPSGGLGIRKDALVQFGDKQDPRIPNKFIQSLAEMRAPIAADLLNKMNEAGPARRLFRCLDGDLRSVSSDRYRIIDNYDIAFAALEAVRANGGEVIEASLSDRAMRLKFTSRSIFESIETARQGGEKGNWYAGGIGSQKHLGRVGARTGGDLPGGPGTVHPLVTVGNSETGHGGFWVRVGIVQAICFNLSTVEDVIGKVHLGGKMSTGIYSDQTLKAESKAIFLQARDVVNSAFKPDVFKRVVLVAQKAASQEISAPSAAVENIVQANGLSDQAKDAILGFFVKDYDLNRYGLAQGVARYAQELDGADEAAQVEKIAGDILKTPLTAAACSGVAA